MKSYNVGELRRMIKEGKSEFNPVLGPNVETEDKRNNEKSYKESEKRAKDYDGGLTEPKKIDLPKKMDGNKTTLDYTPASEPSKEYKEKVQAQAKGYTSKLQQDNDIEKADEYDDDGRILKNLEDSRDEKLKAKKELATSGLQGSKMPYKEKNTLSENKLKPKRLTFKNTRFLNESHMMSRIPEQYKVAGQRIYMTDAENNEYIVECVKSKMTGVVEAELVGYKNESKAQHQMDRIFQLMEYKSEDKYGKTSYAERLNENKSFNDILDKARKF